jgi:hypothetical protein
LSLKGVHFGIQGLIKKEILCPLLVKKKLCHPKKTFSLISNPWFFCSKQICHQVPNFAHLGSYLTLEFNNTKDKKGERNLVN